MDLGAVLTESSSFRSAHDQFAGVGVAKSDGPTRPSKGDNFDQLELGMIRTRTEDDMTVSNATMSQKRNRPTNNNIARRPDSTN
jgi:hypothetical protein